MPPTPCLFKWLSGLPIDLHLKPRKPASSCDMPEDIVHMWNPSTTTKCGNCPQSRCGLHVQQMRWLRRLYFLRLRQESSFLNALLCLFFKKTHTLQNLPACRKQRQHECNGLETQSNQIKSSCFDCIWLYRLYNTKIRARSNKQKEQD